MTRLRAAPLVLALAAACSDDPTGPELATSLEILSGSEPFDEQTIGLGGTLQLTAAPRDESRKNLVRSIRWTTSDARVAAVGADGLVTGMGPGVAFIVASTDARSDTARVNVALPVSGPVACSAGRAGLALAVGEARETTGWEVGTLCLEGGAAGAEYVVIPFHASGGAGRLGIELAAAGVLPAAGPPSPSRSLAAGTVSAPDEAFHLRLRERARRGLAGRAEELARHGERPPSFSRAASVPAVGDRLRLNVETLSSDGCSRPDYRTGRVIAVTRRAIVVADTANPRGGFTDAEYRAFGTAFDELVYPLHVEHFGEPSDLDSNERAVIFFTAAVNDLTTPGSGSYIGGFFYDRDLFPRSGSGACVGSNASEMFYMMVPDPSRERDEPAFSRASVKGHTVAVIGHEFQHLINASRRLHVHRAPVWEETWLNEGLSHIAEELLFYRTSGLTPGGNEDGSRLTSVASRQALAEYQMQNLERYIRFLRSPQTSSAIWGEDLATRGAIWAFLRYAADRRGGDERELWHRLVNSTGSGIENLRGALRADAVAWIHDWTRAVYLDDSGLPTPAVHRQASWNFRRLLPALHDLTGRAPLGTFPLRTLEFGSDPLLGLALPGGSAAFIRVGVATERQAAVRITSGGLPAPQKLRLTVIRTR